jgi:hypothetical protein
MSGRLAPALWGGVFIGVLSALPLVNLGNCCCCLWVVLGGVLATYLRQQNFPFEMTAAEGALVGLFAGLIGGLLGAVLSIPIEMMMAPIQREWIERILSSNPELPAEMRDMVDTMAVGPAALVFRFVANIVLGAIFGMLGGLLGVAIFKKNVPPPPPPGTVEVLPPPPQ